MYNNDELNQQTNDMSSEQNINNTEYRYSGNNIPFNNSYQQYSGQQYNTQDSANSTAYSNTAYNQGNMYGNAGYNTNTAYNNTNTANTSYGTNTANASGMSAKPKKEKKPKQKGQHRFAKRAAALIASAAVFGAVAGGVMYGVYYTGVHVFPATNTQNFSNSNVDIPTVTSNISTSSIVNEEAEGVTAAMDVSAVAKAAMPAMVALQGTTTVSSSGYYWGGGQSYEATTSGTGIIVGKNDTELLILTNAHVVEDVNGLKCIFTDNESVSCTVKGSKADKDIAVVSVSLSDIKSDTLSKISIAELANSEDVVVGQQVVAIGNALGEGQSVTNGIISATDRSITVNSYTFEGLFMTNAAINSGNSGGALLNADGKVIGINFAKTSETGVEGMAYAIPVSNVRELIDSLMNRQTRTKVNDSEASYLGISGMDITNSMASAYGYPQGLMIQIVASGSAAEKAGLGKYDIIISFDDQTVSSMAGLQSIMQYYAAGETVTIEYYHQEGNQYVKKSVDVVLDKKK